MYFKRISDLHPLDAKTISAGKSTYYNLDTLWVEVSQTFDIISDVWTPVSSSPAYPNDSAIVDNNRVPATNHETLSAVDAYLSRKCSIAEIFKNVGDMYVTSITAQFADLSYITSYYLEGKDRSGGDTHIYFNLRRPLSATNNPHISSTIQLEHTKITVPSSITISSIPSECDNIPAKTYYNTFDMSNTIGAAAMIDSAGLSAKQLHAQFQFSVDYIAATATNCTVLSANIGTGVSANTTGLTACNIYVPGEAILTAAAAYWADLAELYRADAAYPVGTLVKFGGHEEITLADSEANAVVTEKPAYLMNTKLRDLCDNPTGLVLTGRSRVRTIGPICKFDRLGLSTTPGVACKSNDNVIGIALETNLIATEKLVEATLRLNF